MKIRYLFIATSILSFIMTIMFLIDKEYKLSIAMILMLISQLGMLYVNKDR